jgi:hypothetical protein
MKQQLLGIFFYLLYLLAMVRPVLPILEYYANYDYIVAELCENRDKPFLECNGKCYLAKELKKVNTTSQNHKSNIPSIDLEKYPVAPITYFTYAINTFNSNSNQHIFVCKYKLKNVYSLLLRPPQIFL